MSASELKPKTEAIPQKHSGFRKRSFFFYFFCVRAKGGIRKQ